MARRGLGIGIALAALALIAAPVMAQDSNEQLKKELDQLKKEVDALKQEKAEAKPVDGAKAEMKFGSDNDSVLDMLFREAKIGGFVDVGFVYNIDRPNNGKNGALNFLTTPFGGAPGAGDGSVRCFDRDSRTFYLHNAQLNIARAPTKEMIVGYNVELSFGSDPNTFGSGPGGLGDYFDVQEANVQILAPVGTGLTITAGKFATFAGYEVVEAKDNYNYSRGLPYLFAIPFLHTGVRATYSFSEQISATLGAVNGWDNVEDNNDGKTLEFNLTVNPAKWLKALVNFYYGAEKSPTSTPTSNARDDGDKRMLLDIVATVSDIPGLPGLTLGFNYDMGEEEDSAVSASGSIEDAEWSAFAVYIRYQINEQWAGAFRYSMIDDENLFRTTGGASWTTFSGSVVRDNTISEFTLTLEWTPVKGLKTRLEYRMDMSDEDIFLTSDTNPSGNPFEDSQSTIGAEIIVEF